MTGPEVTITSLKLGVAVAPSAHRERIIGRVSLRIAGIEFQNAPIVGFPSRKYIIGIPGGPRRGVDWSRATQDAARAALVAVAAADSGDANWPATTLADLFPERPTPAPKPTARRHGWLESASRTPTTTNT